MTGAMKALVAAGIITLSLGGTVAIGDSPAMKDDAPVVAFVASRQPGNIPRGEIVPREMEAAANEPAVPKDDAETFRARIKQYVYYMGFGFPGFGNPEPVFNFPAGVLSASRMLEKVGMPDAVELSWQKIGAAKSERRIKRLFYDRSVFQFDAAESVESLTVYDQYLVGLNRSNLSPAPGYEKEAKRPSAKWGLAAKLMEKLLKDTPATQKEVRQQLGDWWRLKTLQPDRRSLVYTCDDGLLIVIVDPTRATPK